MKEIRIKKLVEEAIIPTRGGEQSAGYDLYAVSGDSEDLSPGAFRLQYMQPNHPIMIPPHRTVRIHTGIAIEIPEGYYGAIFARSGIATKQGLRPANCAGVVDADYRGEIIVALHNDTDMPQMINAGDRVAQLVILPYLPVEFVEVEELGKTVRGVGGFGSTGA